MTARILVVDDNVANIKLLEARLAAEYFEVVTAMNGPEALEICARGQCDIVLLDVMMPGMDGFETCRRLKANPRTAHVPVIIVTALDQPSDRVTGLEAGADDFLTKPVNDIALITRVKSLVRLKMLTDELLMRAATTTGIGLEETMDPATLDGLGGRILLVEDIPGTIDRVRQTLGPHHTLDIESDPQEALFKAAEGDYDMAIVSLTLVQCRRAQALLAAPLARPDAAHPDPGHRRPGGQHPASPRPRPRDQRLSRRARSTAMRCSPG